MTKSALECLRELAFLGKNNSIANLEKFSQQEIKEKLDQYYCHRLTHFSKEISELRRTQVSGSSLISSLSASNAVLPLCPKLLVQEKLYANDPLVKLATPVHGFSRTERAALGIVLDEPININILSNKLKFFSALAPFVEGGFLAILPFGALHEPPVDLPFYAPKNYFRELVPENVVEYVHKCAKIQPVAQSPDGLLILSGPNIQRNRQVSILFEGDEEGTHGYFYAFREGKKEGKTEDGSILFSYPPWDDRPLDEITYNLWIEQSINKIIGNRLESISKEMGLAESFGATYLTESTFEANLLACNSESGGSTNDRAIRFLQANAGILNIDDPQTIFRLRTENVKFLDRFRLSLRSISEELIGLSGDDFSEKAKRLFEKEIQPQIAEINNLAGRIQSNLAVGLIGSVGAIFLGIMSGTILPFSVLLGLAALGTAPSLPSIGDYQRIKKQPQFIWHRLKK